MKVWLKHKEDGMLYDWHPVLAKHPKLEEITDEQAFPEKYAAPEVIAKVEEIKAKHGETLDLFTDMIPDEVAPPTNDELNDELTVRTRKRVK